MYSPLGCSSSELTWGCFCRQWKRAPSLFQALCSIAAHRTWSSVLFSAMVSYMAISSLFWAWIWAPAPFCAASHCQSCRPHQQPRQLRHMELTKQSRSDRTRDIGTLPSIPNRWSAISTYVYQLDTSTYRVNDVAITRAGLPFFHGAVPRLRRSTETSVFTRRFASPIAHFSNPAWTWYVSAFGCPCSRMNQCQGRSPYRYSVARFVFKS